MNRDTTPSTALTKLPDLSQTLSTQAQNAAALNAAGPAIFRTIGDIAQAKQDEAEARRREAEARVKANPNDAQAQADLNQANQDVAYWREGGIGKTILHGLGGLVLGGVAGATGAVANETLLPTLIANSKLLFPDPVTTGNAEADRQAWAEVNAQRADYLKLGSTLIGAATGGAAGANVAQTATSNNYLKHPELVDKRTRLAACQTDACRKQVEVEFQALSDKNDNARIDTCLNGSYAQCQAKLNESASDWSALQADIARLQDSRDKAKTPAERAAIDAQIRDANTNLNDWNALRIDELAIKEQRFGLTPDEKNELSVRVAASGGLAAVAAISGGLTTTKRPASPRPTKVTSAEDVVATAGGNPSGAVGQPVNYGQGPVTYGKTTYRDAQGNPIQTALIPEPQLVTWSAAPRPTGNPVDDAPVLAHVDGSIWVPNVTARGAMGEDLLNRDVRGIGLHNNERVIDVFDATTGSAVSMKTLDWNTNARITDPKQIENRIKSDVNKLVEYDGTGTKDLIGIPGVDIQPAQIKSKTLELILPANGGTPEQVAAVNRAIVYAQNKGITVIVVKAK